MVNYKVLDLSVMPFFKWISSCWEITNINFDKISTKTCNKITKINDIKICVKKSFIREKPRVNQDKNQYIINLYNYIDFHHSPHKKIEKVSREI